SGWLDITLFPAVPDFSIRYGGQVEDNTIPEGDGDARRLSSQFTAIFHCAHLKAILKSFTNTASSNMQSTANPHDPTRHSKITETRCIRLSERRHAVTTRALLADCSLSWPRLLHHSSTNLIKHEPNPVVSILLTAFVRPAFLKVKRF
ncbi:hypothetical protein CCUS01_10815, partial [Colletotrichum cuscutae]